jgi:hypothetical protein
MHYRFTPMNRNMMAYHEAGHAVVGFANDLPLWNEGITISGYDDDEQNVTYHGVTWTTGVSDEELSVVLALDKEKRRHINEIESRMGGVATEEAYELGNTIYDDDIRDLAEQFVHCREEYDKEVMEHEGEDLHRAFMTMDIVYRQARFGWQDDVVMPKDLWEFSDLVSTTVHAAYENAKLIVLEHKPIMLEYVRLLLDEGKVDAEVGNQMWEAYTGKPLIVET